MINKMKKAILAMILASAVVAGFAHAGEEAAIEVRSDLFKDGEMLPLNSGFFKGNLSPSIMWSNLPPGTKSVTIICNDPDAPRGSWIHWTIYNIPPETNGLPEGVPPEEVLADGAVQGINDFGRVGWGGPAPPSGVHRYIFYLYALDKKLDPTPNAHAADISSAMMGHIIGRGQLTGRYAR